MAHAEPEPDAHLKRSSRGVIIFWVVILLLVGPTMFFVWKSFEKLNEVQGIITSEPHARAADYVVENALGGPDISESEKALRATILLEADVMQIRYKRASAGLTTRTWLEFMCLIFGAILVMIGSAFVLARIATVSPTKAALESGGIRGNFEASSPGLVLALIGAALIVLPNIGVGKMISVDDTGTYVAKSVDVMQLVASRTSSRSPSATAAAIVPPPTTYQQEVEKRCKENPELPICKLLKH